MTRSSYVLVLTILLAGGSSIQAQARPQPQDPKATVPRSHLPPPGMCRIWLDNVPAAQQPAPTDCASAVRNQPRNARVIFSEAPRNANLPIKSLKEPVQAQPLRKGQDEPKVGPDGKPVKRPKPDSR